VGPLSRWAVRRPWAAIGAWFVLVLVVVVLGKGYGGTLNDSFSLPDTESTHAQALLVSMPGASGSAATANTANVVWSPQSGQVTDPAVAAAVVPLLTRVSALPGVACVTNPYDRAGKSLGASCPKAEVPQTPPHLPPAQQQAYLAGLKATQAALSPISPDGKVAKAVVTFSATNPGDVPVATGRAILADVAALNGQAGLQVGANGQVLSFAGTDPPSSEGFGVLVALIILLVAFGSLLAAVLPLVTALFGVSLGASLLLFVARFTDVATFAPTLAAMIGLGVGIDYSLFVINRFRQGVMAGHDAKSAALESVNTSGRAVVFAASTVIIALLGLFVMRITFFNGLALAAGGTVLLVMLSAVWLLPALLSLFGAAAITPVAELIARGLRRIRLGALAAPFDRLYGLTRHSRRVQAWHPEGGRWAHYARFLQRHHWVAMVVSLAVVLVLAIPVLSLRLGFADDSGQPEGSSARIAYDLTAQGFGPGVNGPFYVAVQLPKPADSAGLGVAVGALERTPGVARTIPSTGMLPLVAGQLAKTQQTVTAVQVIPTTGPQDQATSDLLSRLRTETLPQVKAATGVAGYVGGTTAIVEDFTSVLVKAMPLFLLIVVGLGFVMLAVLFRAVVVPLTAVVTSLLSFAAAMGITVAVFQWGWLSGILGISGVGPIFPFLPVMVFSILFGLSMDYEVFLVSRMQEEWARTHDNPVAVRRGLAGSGRVVLMAALIMGSVFAAFIPTANSTIKLFGISLTSAVLIDAFVIRLVFVPAFMSVLGASNWWLPAWLAARLPHFEVEGSDEITDDESFDLVESSTV